MRRTWIAGFLISACASAPASPYYGDEQYLVFGTRPDSEAVLLAQQLEQSGYPLVLRLAGQTFTALGFSDSAGSRLKVRVVTARGIALALDPESADAFHAGVSYSLLPAPLSDTHDADGDGFEELFVQAQPGSGEPPCILIFRVRDSGFVDSVPGHGYGLARGADASDAAWRDPQFCQSEAEPDAGNSLPDAGVPSSAASAPSPPGSPAAH